MSSAAPRQSATAPASDTISLPGSSPEFRLLRACCAASLSTAGQIPPADNSLDWDLLAKLAEHHGVIPLIYECFAQRVSAQYLAPLQKRYQGNARQTLWLTREMFRILERMDQLGIAAIPYKGPVLAQMLYGNVVQRQFGDIDILIHANDLGRAKSAILELGYTHDLKFTAKQERAYLQSGYEYTFDSPSGRNLLELQWKVLPRFYAIDFDSECMFKRTQKIEVGGRTVQTLATEDLVLVLCVHAAKHAWVQLSWLCDLANLTLRQKVDWGVVQKEARQLGIERIVAVTFLLANRFLDVTIPVPISPSADLDRLVTDVEGILCESSPMNTESLHYFKLMMDSRERHSDRFRFLWRLAATPGISEWSVVRLPGPLFPLYRLVRAARLAGRLLTH